MSEFHYKNEKAELALLDIALCIIIFILAVAIINSSITSSRSNLDLAGAEKLMNRAELTLDVFLRTSVNLSQSDGRTANFARCSEIIAEVLYFKNNGNYDFDASLMDQLCVILSDLTRPSFDFGLLAGMNDVSIILALNLTSTAKAAFTHGAVAERLLVYNFPKGTFEVVYSLYLWRL